LFLYTLFLLQSLSRRGSARTRSPTHRIRNRAPDAGKPRHPVSQRPRQPLGIRVQRPPLLRCRQTSRLRGRPPARPPGRSHPDAFVVLRAAGVVPGPAGAGAGAGGPTLRFNVGVAAGSTARVDLPVDAPVISPPFLGGIAGTLDPGTFQVVEIDSVGAIPRLRRAVPVRTPARRLRCRHECSGQPGVRRERHDAGLVRDTIACSSMWVGAASTARPRLWGAAPTTIDACNSKVS